MMAAEAALKARAIGRGQTQYPAVFAYDGTVTELESYGKGGGVYASSIDGGVLIGHLDCTNPPTCTTSGSARWSGSAAPTVLDIVGFLRATSSSGTIMAGDGSESSTGFLFDGSARTLIPGLSYVAALTPDGKYVAGRLQDLTKAGLWSAQTATITNIGSSTWTNTMISGVNGTDPAVVGYGYVSSTDSYVGFRWKGGVLTELGFLAGGTSTSAYAVSSDGSTVVGSTGTSSLQEAFIWTDSSKLRTVLDELKARGLEPAVDLRISATFISDDGKTLVGYLSAPTPGFMRIVLQ
jgi:uncharacterized membrane protein